jgi:hypothetical protein
MKKEERSRASAPARGPIGRSKRPIADLVLRTRPQLHVSHNFN